MSRCTMNSHDPAPDPLRKHHAYEKASGMNAFLSAANSWSASSTLESSVRLRPRLYENADAEINRATIESTRWRGRIIVAVKANFLIQYFVPVSRKSFPHSLSHNRTLKACGNVRTEMTLWPA